MDMLRGFDQVSVNNSDPYYAHRSMYSRIRFGVMDSNAVNKLQ